MAGQKLLKRKGVDEISDDFSDFSLSSPATKIRRLDAAAAAVLPPIVEEDELPPPAPTTANEERALVLFKPLHHHSPSSYSLTVDSGILSEIKNQQLPWWSREEEQDDDDDDNHRLAIVPWVPQPSISSTLDDDNSNAELMEADDDMGEQEEEGGEGVMEIEQEQEDTPVVGNTSTPSFTSFPATLNLPEGFQQQQQQHCFFPQLPQNTSTPITWTR